MKKIGIIILFAAIIIQGFSQESSAVNKSAGQKSAAVDTTEITKVVVGNNRLVVEDGKESLSVRIGNRGVSILESLEGNGPKLDFRNYRETESFRQDEDNDSGRERERRARYFKGHWAGIEAGFNNYLTKDNSLVLPDTINFMSLHSGKAMNFNLNFSQLSMGITRHIGFVTGLGLNWNNYRFDGNNNIIKGTDGIIEVLDPGANLKKSKLTTLYFNIPLMLEFQIPTDHNYLHIAAGPIGAVKLMSYSKMVYEDGDKVKSDGDFSLNLLRYGATARIGYENFQVYGTYYKTPLFKSGKEPGGVNLYPFEVGIAFTIN
jgi:hypothetical protein